MLAPTSAPASDGSCSCSHVTAEATSASAAAIQGRRSLRARAGPDLGRDEGSPGCVYAVTRPRLDFVEREEAVRTSLNAVVALGVALAVTVAAAGCTGAGDDRAGGEPAPTTRHPDDGEWAPRARGAAVVRGRGGPPVGRDDTDRVQEPLVGLAVAPSRVGRHTGRRGREGRPRSGRQSSLGRRRRPELQRIARAAPRRQLRASARGPREWHPRRDAQRR